MKKHLEQHKLFYIILAALVGFLLPGSGAIIGMAVLGGVIQSGILGGFSGKVGNVVGGKWKETDYMRKHTIPKNPQTADQMNQRNRMKMVVNFARQIKSTVIDAYWSPFYSAMSGFNAFVKNNASYIDFPSLLLSAASKITKGGLLNTSLLTSVYTSGTGSVSITWTINSNVGNALGTDEVGVIIASKDGILQLADIGNATRSDGEANLTIGTGLTASDIFVYLFFYRGTGSSLIVSDSVGRVCTA